MREDWIETELGRICVKALKVKRKEMHLNESFIYLDIGAINNITNKITDHKIYTWKNAPSRAQQIVKKGDVLFSTVRTYLKNIAQITGKEYENQICSSGFTVLRGRTEFLESKYLFFFSVSDIFLNPLNKLQTGTSYPAVRDKDVFSQTIPLPPLPEQRAIVAKIEQVFSALDQGVQSLEKAQAQLKTYQQAVLQKAFEGELTKAWREAQTDLPMAEELLEKIKREREQYYAQQLMEWEAAVTAWASGGKVGRKPGKARKLEDITISNPDEYSHKIPDSWLSIEAKFVNHFITKGTTPTKNDLFQGNGEIPFIKVYNLTNNKGLDFSINPTFVSRIVHEGFLKRSIVFPNDVLMNIVGPPLGKVSIVPNMYREWNINQAIARFRTLKILVPRFLAHFLVKADTIQTVSKKAKATAGQFNLTLEICRNIDIPICSIQEQHQIVQEIESRLSVCDKLEESIQENLKKAEALRQSILKKAFEGRLLSEAELAACRQEADWEPAADLLARIKEEKDKK